jgi:ATP-dependent exoDNAse (exonuclease V) alpha subunit
LAPASISAASGEWVNDRAHGQQFKARFLRTSPPSSADGIEKYLSSGMIRGVGPVYAKKLVRAFGGNVIETTPDRLREVDGIGPVRAASILAAAIGLEDPHRSRGAHTVAVQALMPSRSCPRTRTGSRAIFAASAHGENRGSSPLGSANDFNNLYRTGDPSGLYWEGFGE